MRKFLALALCMSFSSALLADEGMWTLDHPPIAKIAQTYQHELNSAWLARTQKGAVRLAQGCSGSFVSAEGLVMSNHHCAHACIEQLSQSDQDFVKQGFYAANLHEERRCPEMEVNQLQEISDLTDRLKQATAGKEGVDFAGAQRAEIAKIKGECARDEATRCDVVSLYGGGRYALYRYKRYQDVRLVFAPEFAIAFFGGDPFNFTFPRYNLDLAFLRVYHDGKPLESPEFFPFAKAAPNEGELLFVAGHPGRTSRDASLDELIFERDYILPRRLAHSAELRGQLTEFSNRSSEAARVSQELLFSLENGLKSMKGRHATLIQQRFMEQKGVEEGKLRKAIESDTKLRALYGQAWDKLSQATERLKPISTRYALIEGGSAFDSEIFAHARRLVRYAREVQKPNADRLREYVDSNLPTFKQQLRSSAPISKELEELRLRFGLTKLVEDLGPGDPFVQATLGKKSPSELARELVQSSALDSPLERIRLFEGGVTAIQRSKDPMLRFAAAVDPEARSLRQIQEEDIGSEITRAHALIAQAKFAIYGNELYPDASFSLRLSYGSIAGVRDNERVIEPTTNLGGAFDLARSSAPFVLPTSWLKAQSKLDLSTPFNMITNHDIIGGNSGSPVLNRSGEVVGLIFDGNLASLGGRYWFDATQNRAVAVHVSGILETLDKVYGARALMQELRLEKKDPPRQEQKTSP